MSITVYSPKGDEVQVPDSKVKYYESIGYSTEKPAGRKSRKPPVNEEGPEHGED